MIASVSLSLLLAIGGQVSADPPAPGEKPLAEELPRIPPREPHEALKTLKAQAGFRMDLIASEPLVTDPIASEYDENGRMYVVEMRGYPFQKERGTPPICRIRLLEEENGDGVYDKSWVFVDGLSWPTGLALWKGGVFVVAAPDIYYFKDTDGDRQADVRRTVFTGLGTKNVQALPNNLKWGLDHKIYGATAGNGGDVVAAEKPGAQALALRGRDFRFDPAALSFEAVPGTAQFGNSFDAWGNRFVCSNSDHAQHVVVPGPYLERNAYVAAPGAIHSIAKEGGAGPVFRTSAAEPWRIVRTRRRAASGQKYAPSELVPIGFFTSASGITIYGGAAYPEEYRGNLFVGDVGANLIHRKRLAADGVTFVATRADEKVEFVTSTDNWFRPVNFTNAPDGTLHVLDMYRETIEHPWSIPDDIKALLDLESGRDRGRVYRLTPPGFQPVPAPRLGSATTAQLVALLEHPNVWQRQTAHRLLYERQDPAAERPLRVLAAESKVPLARLHALYSLAGIGKLSDADLAGALGDSSPGVREHAVRLAERRLGNPEILQKVAKLAGDPEIRVRFQAAFSLGEVVDPRASDALAEIARHDASDFWLRSAVLSSAANQAHLLIDALCKSGAKKSDRGQLAFLRQLAFIVGVRNAAGEVQSVLAHCSESVTDGVRSNLLVGLADGLQRSRSSLAKVLEDPRQRAVRQGLQAAMHEAAKTIGDETAPLERRLAAAELLGYWSLAKAAEPLAGALETRQPQALQLAAVRAVAGFADPQVAKLLLANWSSHTPATRAEVIEALLSRPTWIGPLLDAVAAGNVSASQLDAARKEQLLKHRDAAVRRRAAALFGKDAPSPRGDVVARYQKALSLVGDSARGQVVFERECMTCHKLGDKGFSIGPDLATIQNRTPDALMTQILDPNREVLPNYIDYVVGIDDGRVATGIIAVETATSITLRRAQNIETTVLRQNIETIRSTGKSLMPEGFEEKITPQEMADLLALLLAIRK